MLAATRRERAPRPAAAQQTTPLSGDSVGQIHKRAEGSLSLLHMSRASSSKMQRLATTCAGTTWKLLLSHTWWFTEVTGGTSAQLSMGAPVHGLPTWALPWGWPGLPRSTLAAFQAWYPQENQTEVVLSLAPQTQSIISTMVTARQAQGEGKGTRPLNGRSATTTLWAGMCDGSC